MKSTQTSEQVTAYTFVGNIGCIRFPSPIRKVSGIKRGDRLVVRVQDAHTIQLEKLGPFDLTPAEAIRVEQCGCPTPPAACRNGGSAVVTVGWSYVELKGALAKRLGFLPNRAVKLVGEPLRITVSLHRNLRNLKGIERVACPP
jgi:bifunctional DNA-binding transcriptional regulator/antitoxin component of YhaV-PrlF toxin-antitoxin module